VDLLWIFKRIWSTVMWLKPNMLLHISLQHSSTFWHSFCIFFLQIICAYITITFSQATVYLRNQNGVICWWLVFLRQHVRLKMFHVVPGNDAMFYKLQCFLAPCVYDTGVSDDRVATDLSGDCGKGTVGHWLIGECHLYTVSSWLLRNELCCGSVWHSSYIAWHGMTARTGYVDRTLTWSCCCRQYVKWHLMTNIHICVTCTFYCTASSHHQFQGHRSLWDRGNMSPQYLWRGDVHGNVPPNILEFLYFAARFILSSNSNNCSLLYFKANIMCSLSKKLQFQGDFIPQTFYWGSALDLAGDRQTPSLFYVLPIILWDECPWPIQYVLSSLHMKIKWKWQNVLHICWQQKANSKMTSHNQN